MAKELPDLEKQRDEKCIPIAKEVLKDLEQLMIPEDANNKIDLNPLILKLLTRTFDADFNIEMENSYLFQLVLGVLSGLNGAVQTCDTALIDDVRYGKIQKEILSYIADGNIRMGNVTPEDNTADFVPVKGKLNALFKRENMSMLEVKYVMDNIFDLFKKVTDIFNRSVEQSSARAEAKAFGIDSMHDLTMKKLDSVLKSEVK